MAVCERVTINCASPTTMPPKAAAPNETCGLVKNSSAARITTKAAAPTTDAAFIDLQILVEKATRWLSHPPAIDRLAIIVLG
jgi:hypothetical protein